MGISFSCLGSPFCASVTHLSLTHLRMLLVGSALTPLVFPTTVLWAQTSRKDEAVPGRGFCGIWKT